VGIWCTRRTINILSTLSVLSGFFISVQCVIYTDLRLMVVGTYDTKKYRNGVMRNSIRTSREKMCKKCDHIFVRVALWRAIFITPRVDTAYMGNIYIYIATYITYLFSLFVLFFIIII
jgi:hypothetical protein